MVWVNGYCVGIFLIVGCVVPLAAEHLSQLKLSFCKAGVALGILLTGFSLVCVVADSDLPSKLPSFLNLQGVIALAAGALLIGAWVRALFFICDRRQQPGKEHERGLLDDELV